MKSPASSLEHCLLVAAIAVTLVAPFCQAAAVAGETQIAHLMSELFAPQLTPDETLQRLKVLEADHAVETSEEKSLVADIKALISFSEIADEKCNLLSIYDLKDAMTAHEKLTGTIVPYLEAQASALFAHCAHLVEEAAVQVDETKKAKVQLLKAAIHRELEGVENMGQDDWEFQYDQAIKRAVLSFINQQQGAHTEGNLSGKELEAAYEEHVGSICKDVYNKIGHVTRIYRLGDSLSHLMTNLSPVVSEAVDEVRSCSDATWIHDKLFEQN